MYILPSFRQYLDAPSGKGLGLERTNSIDFKRNVLQEYRATTE